MAVTSDRSIIIQSTGDVEYQQTFTAGTNVAGSGQNQLVDLVSGNNTITVPDDAVAVTIIKPSDNEVVIKLRGVNGDTGVILSPTDPDSISLDAVSTFVLNASDAVTVRLIFS